MPKLYVLLKREEIDPGRLEGRVNIHASHHISLDVVAPWIDGRLLRAAA